MSALTFAIPSKGRLKENAEAWLARCGFRLKQRGGSRGYQAELAGLPDVDVMLLSAREIAEGLLSGRLHLGVTGEDLLNDLAADLPRQAHVFRQLGFGHARMVVAAPKAWIDVDTMADLEAVGAQFRARHGRRLRVATKYLNATRRFFAARSVGEYRLVDSAGATEAAPSAGTAELIVDITTTGATLAANDLKILSDGLILKSEAALTGSLSADWHKSARATLRRLLDSVEAQATASGLKRLVASKPIPESLAKEISLTNLTGNQALCCLESAPNAAARLCEEGLGPVSLEDVDYVFSATNVAFDNFMKIL